MAEALSGSGSPPLLFFFIPQGIAVIELSHHMPGEGGAYLWAKHSFGEFHGFLCGWLYWTSNMFFVPTLLFYLSGIPAYFAGTAIQGLGENRLFFFALTVSLLWLTIWVNVRGVQAGKWISNSGGAITITLAIILIGLGRRHRVSAAHRPQPRHLRHPPGRLAGRLAFSASSVSRSLASNWAP